MSDQDGPLMKWRYLYNKTGVVIEEECISIYIPGNGVNKVNLIKRQDLGVQLDQNVVNHTDDWSVKDFIKGVNLYKSLFYVNKILPYPVVYLHDRDELFYLSASSIDYYHTQILSYFTLICLG